MRQHRPEIDRPMELDRDASLTDVALLLRELIINIRDIREILRDAHTLDGTTMTNIFQIPKGWPVVKIDFIESKHVNTPRQTSFEVPLVPVMSLKLNNLGPGTLYYSTNKFLNQLEAASSLLPGESETINTPKRSIRQINLAASGDGCNVRMQMLM